MPSKDVNSIAARMLLKGDDEKSKMIKKSTEASIGNPLKDIIVDVLGEETDLECKTKKKIASKIVDNFYDQLSP